MVGDAVFVAILNTVASVIVVAGVTVIAVLPVLDFRMGVDQYIDPR